MKKNKENRIEGPMLDFLGSMENMLPPNSSEGESENDIGPQTGPDGDIPPDANAEAEVTREP